MKYGITEIAIVPLRSPPSEGSEMLSQLLFGEWFEVLIERSNWTKVKLFHDGYEGWIDTKTISFITHEKYEQLCSDKKVSVVSEPFLEIENQKHERFYLPGGTTLPYHNGNQFEVSGNNFTIIGKTPVKFTATDNQLPVVLAMQYLNSPYLWGGRTPWGIDCSGLTQTVYRILGISIPRDASKQVQAGTTVNLLSEAKPGDLAFFDDNNGHIKHVGIIAENGKIVHASGKVRIDNIDHNGIFNTDRHIYTHNLRVIKRIIQ